MTHSHTLYQDWRAGAIRTRPELRRYVMDCWIIEGTRQREPGWLTDDQWRELFRAADFAPPTEPTRLYRGTTHENRDHWSWTPSRRVAARYAVMHPDGPPVRRTDGAQVYTTIAPPHAVLATWIAGTIPEYVVDTEGLTIDLAP